MRVYASNSVMPNDLNRILKFPTLDVRVLFRVINAST